MVSATMMVKRRIVLNVLLVLAAAAMAAAGAAPSEKVFEVRLVDGRAAADRSTLRIGKGDKVELRWTSDRPIVLHLHGYDIETTVAPQAPATMAFSADIAGRFPVSEHRHGGGHARAVLYLEVHP
jgi:hypothetical protein